MLKNWHIAHFKPILDSGELALAPVTILAGRNSSGKSSFIQSILMVAQTLSSPLADRPLLPNGPLVQLGTFDDILNDQTRDSSPTLLVSFELEMDNEEQESAKNNRSRRTRKASIADPNIIHSVKVTSHFRSSSINGSSNSAINASKVHLEQVALRIRSSLPSTFFMVNQIKDSDIKYEPIDFDVDIKRIPVSELETFLTDVLSEYNRLIPYPQSEQNYLGTTTTTYNAAIEPSHFLVAFSHFLPIRLIEKYDIQKNLLNRLVNLILSDLMGSRPASSAGLLAKEGIDIGASLQDDTKDRIVEFNRENAISPTCTANTFSEAIQWYRSVSPRKDFDTAIKFAVILSQALQRQTFQAPIKNNQAAKGLEISTNTISAVLTEKSVDDIIRFFASKIRHLGPLRSDPQAAQGFSPTSELDVVGERGEFAAAVYEANQHAPIRWYHPLEETIQQNTLGEAINVWARYLGIAEEVKTSQTAVHKGVSWRVVLIKGHRDRPLTDVGVGISQLLPILVMGLLAPAHSLLLFEQPELHLHSRVQARLGDFFMGVSRCDKQCLIETHSENLISQLRLHIVKADEAEKGNCLIYFVDQDRQGSTQFTPIHISPKGNILNWPDGFFDETLLQEDRIMAASGKKRAK